MNYWSNIEISPEDFEIIEINKLEKSLGELSKDILNVRELIRRFELCHFKYKEHLKYINDSIKNLSPNIEPTTIGINHISKGLDVLKNDKTGRSIPGQQYLCSLLAWLGDHSQENSEYFNNELNNQIANWLGNKDNDKERIVRLLVARLMWDWKTYKEFQNGREYKELELQACRMDICHYAFSGHLDLLLQGIGRMEAIDNFEGCGSFNAEIKSYIEKEFSILCEYLKPNINKANPEKTDRIKIWLTASLAKTLKEQAGLKINLPILNKIN